MKNINFKTVMSVVLSVIITGTGLLSAEQNLIKIKCTKCHGEKIPDNYSKKEWKYNVERMAQRAGLTDKEIKAIIEMNTKK